MKWHQVIPLILLITVQTSHAQQFKWVRGGGSPDAITPSRLNEAARYMCTDPHGNVYVLSNVIGYSGSFVKADTFYYSPAGAFGSDENILITSYNCNGQMRWAKFIGSANENNPYSIAADALGHIYVTGDLSHQSSLRNEQIGYDTSISTYRYGTCAIIQFDTTGHFNWLKYVGGNTSATLAGTEAYYQPIAVDGANHAHYFCYMKSGVDLGLTTSSYGVYDLEYNVAGTLLSATRLNIGGQWFLHSAVIDPVTNKAYVCGENASDYYTGGATDSFFAAAFDASRNPIWMFFCSQNGGLDAVRIDSKKQLYFAGGAGPYTTPTSFSFNGYTVSAPFNTLAIVMKTDSNGAVKWINHYDSHFSGNGFLGVTLLGNNKVAAAGSYIGSTSDGTHTLTTPVGNRYNPYFVITDTGGSFVTMQQLLCNASSDDAGGFSITSDNVGNLYIGGAVEDSVFGGSPPIPAYHTIGGNTDFFVAKYGLPCGCTSASVTASYTTSVVGGDTVTLTYTGSTAALDSVAWNYGDGRHDTGLTVTHVYGATGTYTVCVTVYTDCGTATYCTSLHVTVPPSKVSIQNAGAIRLYPNPVKDELSITGIIENIDYRLLNITGTCLFDGEFKRGNNSVSLKKIPPGIYILEMTGETGQKNMAQIIKE
jgi:hypothetical protein